jgi:hypothetical protein
MKMGVAEKLGEVALRCVLAFYLFDIGWVCGSLDLSRSWAIGAFALVWVLALAYYVGRGIEAKESQDRGIR